LKFIEALRKRMERKGRVRVMVKKFVDIVKSKYLKKKQEKRAKSQKINPSAKV